MNIAPCNPINNVAEPLILESIADAFSEIEKHDLRVDKITLEKERYDELITRKDSLNYLCQNEGIKITEEQAIVGTLFGAELEIADKSKVYGERGFIPSAFYDEEIMHDENWRMSVEIKFQTPHPNRFQRKIHQLKCNLTIIVKSRAMPIYGASQSEMVAIESLREMITEADFRKYLVHGFILVKGQSGRIYQIFRNRAHTIVWEKGTVVEEVCVRIRSHKIPLTDNVIAFKILIETSEEEFKKLGNVYNMAEAA